MYRLKNEREYIIAKRFFTLDFYTTTSFLNGFNISDLDQLIFCTNI